MNVADVHSHLVPGVDDGARDLEQAVRGIERLAAEGIQLVLTTPHLDASTIARPEAFERDQHKVEAAWRALVERCRDRFPDLSFHLGREILLDVPYPDVRDPRVRLNGGHYVLVEFPRLNIPPGSREVLLRIAEQGYYPVIAHVERYWFEEGRELRTLEAWRRSGALFQVNAASVVGKYGVQARDLAWELLHLGWVDLTASDYHARGRTWITEARTALLEHGGEEQVSVLMDVNPRQVLSDQPLDPVEPLVRAGGGWRRILKAFRRPSGAGLSA